MCPLVTGVAPGTLALPARQTPGVRLLEAVVEGPGPKAVCEDCAHQERRLCVCIHIHMYLYIHVHIYRYIHIDIYIYTSLYIMYIYIHISMRM